MQFFNWLLCLILTVVLPVIAKTKAPKELVIDTTYKPEECTNKAQSGDSIKVHYTGTLYDTGKKFDSSLDRNSPLGLKLGAGQVIKGWEKGLQGMCLNEKRKLTIPPDMAYGKSGFGSVIPPESTLVFDVELVGLTPGPNHQEL
ncbi:hypothetical protein Agabi119p4_1489 [Agaricus bisporus var. burnettii]|uniref:peptidylprolyl isomerase n=1 Tax=Agaricus bisporus var. burnettii TaxID=192524 RepID=A0A8H7F7E6_AGABI|nr:hypothetical protein Agabi119p4_1489 [Agaricus bisporus var. burnettii]